MQPSVSLIVIFVASACAQVSIPPSYKERYPHTYKWSKSSRQTRDVTWDKQVGDGKIFGTLGNNEQELFGKAGYKQDIFNDERGKLQGQAYGSRALGANGDSSLLGGSLDWSDKNSKAAIDLTKQIGGPTNVKASGLGVWNFDKDTRLSAGGTLSQDIGHGRPDIGVQAQFQHDW